MARICNFFEGRRQLRFIDQVERERRSLIILLDTATQFAGTSSCQEPRAFMKRVLSIARIVIAILLLWPTTVSCSSAATAVTNDRLGDKTVFRQDYSSMHQVPSNVYLATEIEPYVTANSTLTFDSSNRAVRLDVTHSPIGDLIVGGLSPAISTSVTMDVGFGRTNFNAEGNIRAGGAWLMVTIPGSAAPGTLRIRSYYYDPQLTYVQSEIPEVVTGNSGRFTITIVTDNDGRTDNIYVNGVQKMTSPTLWSNPKFSPTSYDLFVNPSAYFYFTNVAPASSAYIELYSISQTVPEYKYVTPLSSPKMIPFGIDGPHPFQYVRDGLALMVAKGQRGTIWADPLYVSAYSAQDLDSLKKLISNGWELGIHFSERLNGLNFEDATAAMNREYDVIKTTFGTPPTSWCSLGNADNATHADYAYKKYGMVWRNGKNGVGILSNIGNLEDANWTFWEKTSAAGAVFPVFTHRLDTTPAIQFSVSPAVFSGFIQNYVNAGVQIVPYREYWNIIQNSYRTTVSDLRTENRVLRSFTVRNTGGKSRLFIATPSATKVVDQQGYSVPFEKADGGIVIEVPSGDYTLTSGGSP